MPPLSRSERGGAQHCQETRRASPSVANESSITPRDDTNDVKVIQLGRQDRGAGTLSFEVIR